MSVTINGSGTISGVSVGGLPDGVVDSDMLASTLDISGNTLTLPSSFISRMWAVETTTNISTTSTSVVSDVFGSGITITTRPNTKIIVTATYSTMSFGSSAARAGLRIKSGTNYYEVCRDVGYNLTDIRSPFTVSKIFTHSSGGSSVTYNAGIISIVGGSCSVNNHPGGTSTLKVFEIENSWGKYYD